MKINMGADDNELSEESSPLDRIVLVTSSKGDTHYEVAVKPNGVAYKCTCPGYSFRGQCKHLDMASEV